MDESLPLPVKRTLWRRALERLRHREADLPSVDPHRLSSYLQGEQERTPVIATDRTGGIAGFKASEAYGGSWRPPLEQVDARGMIGIDPVFLLAATYLPGEGADVDMALAHEQTHLAQTKGEADPQGFKRFIAAIREAQGAMGKARGGGVLPPLGEKAQRIYGPQAFPDELLGAQLQLPPGWLWAPQDPAERQRVAGAIDRYLVPMLPPSRDVFLTQYK